MSFKDLLWLVTARRDPKHPPVADARAGETKLDLYYNVRIWSCLASSSQFFSYSPLIKGVAHSDETRDFKILRFEDSPPPLQKEE